MVMRCGCRILSAAVCMLSALRKGSFAATRVAGEKRRRVKKKKKRGDATVCAGCGSSGGYCRKAVRCGCRVLSAAAAAKGSFAATDAVKKKKKKKGNKEAFQPLGLAVAERRSLPGRR